MDEDDSPLTKGAGYSAHEDAVAMYNTTLEPLLPQVCSHISLTWAIIEESVAKYMSTVQGVGSGALLWKSIGHSWIILRKAYVCHARGTCQSTKG